MLYLILSIICSVSVGILLKIAKKYAVDILQVVTLNYAFAIALCYFSFSPDLSVIDKNSPWEIYIPLGVLLPSVFLILASSIKNIGIVKTDIAQRLSLFIPILAAYFIFKEDFSQLKFIGLAVAFPAMILILSKNKSEDSSQKKWIYPALVLFGFGIIDVFFKQIALQKNFPYTTSLFIVFCIAFVVALLFTAYSVVFQNKKIKAINLLFGSILGILNFGNILFYLKAHKAFSENPSTVFASMNMGVIILGSLAGILLFKEKVTLKNYIGIALALIAIILITFSQLQKA